MRQINCTNLAMLSVFYENSVIEISNRFVSIVFVVKKTNSHLTKGQRHYQHQRLDPMEYSSRHFFP